MLRTVARARVEWGALLLDQTQPGWARRIDIGRLELACAEQCVLGQLFGLYHDGVETLFRHAHAAVASYGFDLFNDEGAVYYQHDDSRNATRHANYRTLQDAWVDAIADRVVPESEAPIVVSIQAPA